MNFVQRIFLKDWPLILANKWLETLIDIEDPNYIRPKLCEAIDINYRINHHYTKDIFREILFKKISCDGKLCKGSCNGGCATAGNIERMPDFNQFCNFQPLYSEILSHFFFKLNDKINVYHLKSRIGILVLYFIDEHIVKPETIDNVFVRKEKHVILNQISNYFYVTDFTLIDNNIMFSHIRNFIDSIIIIIDSNYQQNLYLDEFYSKIQCFSFLKIILVKNIDISDYDNAKIMDYFSSKFPRNKITIYNWMEKAEYFPDYIKKELTMKLRLKVAIRSRFVKKPRTTTKNQKS